MSGDLDEALAVLDEGLTADPQPCREVRLRLERARVLDRIGLHTQTRPVAEALREIEQAEAIASGRDLDLGIRAEIALARAYYHYREEMPGREFLKAETAVQQAIRDAREADEKHVLADAMHQFGLIQTFRRETVAARELFEESLALDREAGSREWMLGEYHRHVALTYVFEEDWNAALPHYVESHQVRLRIEAIDPSLFSALSLGDALVETGSPDEAIVYFEYARDVADRIGSKYALAVASLRIAARREAREEFQEALRSYSEAREAASAVHRDSLVQAAQEGLERLRDAGSETE